MKESSRKRAEKFPNINGWLKPGTPVTEMSHPATANLSDVAKQDIATALELLFDVDDDVVRKDREFVESSKAGENFKPDAGPDVWAGRFWLCAAGPLFLPWTENL